MKYEQAKRALTFLATPQTLSEEERLRRYAEYMTDERETVIPATKLKSRMESFMARCFNEGIKTLGDLKKFNFKIKL
jgi:hypothetical protein